MNLVHLRAIQAKSSRSCQFPSLRANRFDLQENFYCFTKSTFTQSSSEICTQAGFPSPRCGSVMVSAVGVDSLLESAFHVRVFTSRKQVRVMKTPYTPLLYSKTGVHRGMHYFLYFALKHGLWVLVRTASMRRF